MSRVADRSGLRRPLEQCGNRLVVDRATRSWSHVVVRIRDSMLNETRSSVANLGDGQLRALGDRT
jgi:hypothetical protein